jgi:hypothetical protein
MKVELLHLDSVNKPSPISKAVAEIRINTQPCKGINHGWQQCTTRLKSWAGSYLALVPSSTRMPRRIHRGWPDTIPYNINKEVGYRPTRRHTKLLSLGIPYVSYATVHFKCLFIQTQLTRAINDPGGGLPPWSSKFHIRPLILLAIQYYPFLPNCPARSPIMPFYQLFKFSTFHSQTRV